LSRISGMDREMMRSDDAADTLREKFHQAGKMPQAEPGGGYTPHKDGPDAQPDLESEI